MGPQMYRSTPVFSPHAAADTHAMAPSSSSAVAGSIAPALTRRLWYAQWIDWIVEARSHRVILLVMGIWLLNGFDLIFTILAHQQGMLQEENPIARLMLSYGTPSIVLFKIGLVLIGSYPLLRFRTARITELGALVILVAYALLAVHWSECYELYAASISHDPNLAELNVLGN